jgi:CRP-like cAMP-binding protein
MGKVIDAKIQHFFSTYPARHYNQRHILIYSNEPIKHVYFIKEGTVKQYGISQTGEEFILNLFDKHSFLPMSHVLNNTDSKYFFEAETDMLVAEAPADDVVHFLHENPDVLFDLLRRVYKGVDGILGRMELLMAGSAQLRLVYELVVEVRRFGKLRNNAGVVHISEKVLGSRTGLSRETVNREIHKLKEMQLIIVHKNNIKIPDFTALEKILP